MSETLTPKELEKQGKSAFQRGDYLEAAQSFEAARQGYEAQGEILASAEMANNCCVAYLQGEEPEKALKVVEGTDEVFSEAGDLTWQGMALGNFATALEQMDRVDEAIEIYLQSATILEQAGEDKLRANVLQSLSTLQFQEGRQLEALASMQSGIEGVKSPTPQQRVLKRLLNIPFDMMNKNKR